jgi:hypothetical protein
MNHHLSQFHRLQGNIDGGPGGWPLHIFARLRQGQRAVKPVTGSNQRSILVRSRRRPIDICSSLRNAANKVENRDNSC